MFGRIQKHHETNGQVSNVSRVLFFIFLCLCIGVIVYQKGSFDRREREATSGNRKIVVYQRGSSDMADRKTQVENTISPNKALSILRNLGFKTRPWRDGSKYHAGYYYSLSDYMFVSPERLSSLPNYITATIEGNRDAVLSISLRFAANDLEYHNSSYQMFERVCLNLVKQFHSVDIPQDVTNLMRSYRESSTRDTASQHELSNGVAVHLKKSMHNNPKFENCYYMYFTLGDERIYY